MDEAVLKWIHTTSDQNVPLSGALFKEKTLCYARSLGRQNFQASSWWLQKFKTEKIICGERAKANQNSCIEGFNSILRNILDMIPKTF